LLLAQETRQLSKQLFEAAAGAQEVAKALVQRARLARPRRGGGGRGPRLRGGGGLVHSGEGDGRVGVRFGPCLVPVALMFSPCVSVGEEQSNHKGAEPLLRVMEVDKSLPKVVEQVVKNHLQQNPQLAAHREVLRRFLTPYVNWESVKEDTITAYT